MRLLLRSLIFTALSATAIGCGAGNAATKKSGDPRLQRRDTLLAQLREHQQEVDKANFRFTAHATNYERSKDDYQKKLTMAMAARKASGRQLKDLEEKRGQLSRMVADRDRVGEDLAKSFETLIVSQKKRNAAAVSLLTIEGQLWELEEEAAGGRAVLQQTLAAELAEMRSAATQVAETARAQEDAEAATVEKEVEAAAAIGTDARKRDEADQALDKLRDTLEAAVTAYVGALSTCDAAKERYHRKAVALLKPGAAKERVLSLLDQRVNAAKQLDEAQSIVKTATIDRAAQMKQRIAFDSEIDRVVEAGLTTAVKQSVIAGLKKETDAIAKGRTDMQQEDNAALTQQRKIADSEAELNKIGY